MERTASITIRTLLAASILFCGCSVDGAANRSEQDRGSGYSEMVQVYTAQVINSWPHDPAAFTQGLVFHDGVLFEGTGLNGESSVRKVELNTGRVLKRIDLPSQFFGEGIAIHQGMIFELTWTSNMAFVYDLESFQLLKELSYEGEGWGLTGDGDSLIMSDGTNTIRFLDPSTFHVRRTISVVNNGVPLTNLNELEYVKGEIFANIWQTDRIVRIDPGSGRILGWINLPDLHPENQRESSDNVLNGIAYDPVGNRLFVTGKRWPRIFEIRLRNLREERPIRR